MNEAPLLRSPMLPSLETANTLVFTVECGDSTYGVPIEAVQTIFRIENITPVPLAPPAIVGLINLRGKIVTAISFRLILGLPDDLRRQDALAICIERHDEQFALIVDNIGDVVGISEDSRISDPPNSEHRQRGVPASGTFRLQDTILPVLDVESLFDPTRWWSEAKAYL